VIIVGGGISGLVAANELVQNGTSVTLLEGSDQLGGLASYFRSADRYIDRFYHCIMPTDSHLLELIEALGLSDQLYWKSTRMGFIYNERRYPFNTALDLLRFSPLSFSQRLRFGVVSLLLRRLGRGLDLDKVRADTWMCKLFGAEVWERFWEPLFRMKFGSQAGSLPALYIWQRLGRENNVSTRGYLRCGLKGFIEALASAIRSNGGIIRTSTPVRTIQETERGMEILLADQEVLKCDWVLSTVPIPVLRLLVRGSSLEDHVGDWDFPYQGVVTTLCFLSRPLDGFYLRPVAESCTSFDGLIEMSALAETIQYSNRYLIYLVKYCDRNSKVFEESDDSIAERWCSELLDLYADLPLRREEILATYVFKAPFVEPKYQTGYLSDKPSFQVGDTPLFLATTAQIYPHITCMNSSTRLAMTAVNHLHQKLAAIS
jgi:protoporphyrinogen oxidase